MVKLRKQRRKKVYRHNVNRKRLRNKQNSVGNIECMEIKKAWEERKSVRKNLAEMGLSYDPNETIKMKNAKKVKPLLISNSDAWNEEDITENSANKIKTVKSHVADELEKDATAPRVKLFRLPKSQVEWITYLLDTHAKDYKAMTRDKKNYNQETWKQLRAKIKRFKSIPEQYSKYLETRGLSADSSGEEIIEDDD